MKKILALVFLLFFITNPALGLKVKVQDASGSVGESIRVPILVEDAKNLGSMDVVITYDLAILKVKSVGKGELNKGLISSNTKEVEGKGIISIAIADSRGINGSGEIAVITFEGLKEGSSEIVIQGVRAHDVETHLDIGADVQDGKLTVTGKKTPGFEIFLAAVSLIVLAFVSRKLRE